jgi:protein tyrosine/serine phosphatase
VSSIHRRIGPAVTAALVALLVAAPAVAGSRKDHAHSRPTAGQPMKNYGVVWDGKLTRSGLPEEDTGWDWLREQGVKSIVTFLPDDDVDYAGHGFTNVLRIPLSDWGLPTERQAQQFLAFIQDPKNQPVHIHCAAGKDRTGMMAALARYAVDGWSLDKALEEARSYRDGKSLGERRAAWLRRWAAKYPPGTAGSSSHAPADEAGIGARPEPSMSR